VIIFESATMMFDTFEKSDEYRDSGLICSCCGAPPAGKSSGDMTKSGKEMCCDATRKGSSGITAIVRPMDTGYIAYAGTASASIKAVTIR